MNINLKQDILGYNFILYGLQGEEVKIINEFGEIYIVENKKNERYAVHRRYTTTDYVIPKRINETPIKRTQMGKAKGRNASKR